MSVPSSSFRTYRLGAKNKKLADPTGPEVPTSYHVHVAYDQPLPALLEKNGLDVAPEAGLITPENFPWPAAAPAEVEMELFDFSFRSDYGRSGVDEAFVRDKFDMFKFRPATLAELICLSGHLREAYRDQWFEARTIIALGSVLPTTEVVQQKSWFHKEISATRRCYPELECVAGRPRGVLRLSITECDQDGNWPTNTLFLAAPVQL